MTKIMIIEDNALNLHLFTDILRSSGYEVTGLMDSTKAIEELKTMKPDLVLMDIQMPIISGLELIKMVKETPEIKDIPALAVTAFAMKGDEEKILQAGFSGYISKPISVMPFLETISKFVRP